MRQRTVRHGSLRQGRAHGTIIFKTVVQFVPWKAMILYGVGSTEKFGKAFGLKMPDVPSPDSDPISIEFGDRPVFVSPTLAAPGCRGSVWPYLERV